jgi:hypothetical protein
MASENSRQSEIEEKRRFWRQQIEGWRTSGLTRAEYCRQHNLSYDRFIYWKRKFSKESNPAFIELKLPAVPYPKMISPASSLRVSVSRFQVSVDRHFDPETLRELIYTLERL